MHLFYYISFNIVYRLPDGDLEVCENYFQSILGNNSIRTKSVILAGDFNINVLEFEQNKKVQNFVNLMFQFSLVSTINTLDFFYKQLVYKQPYSIL